MAAQVSDAELGRRRARSQAAYYRAVGAGHPGSSCVTLDGEVQATVAPVSPARSLPNAVVYQDPAAVLANYDDLVELYAGAGVVAWTVWVQPGDDELVEQLERRGHRIDGTPAAMGAHMDELDLEPRVALDLDPQPGWDVAGLINDSAYGLEAGALSDPLGGIPPSALPLYVARLDGEAVACAAFAIEGGDCEATFVATLPHARGRGIGAEIMREGLRRGREAGATTATLEASSMGQPVYERLGYRVLGRMRMLELRAPGA